MSRRAPNPKELQELVGKLRDYRLKRGLTEKALAQRLGFAFVTLNRWLNRHTMPSELHAYRIRHLLRKGKGA